MLSENSYYRLLGSLASVNFIILTRDCLLHTPKLHGAGARIDVSHRPKGFWEILLYTTYSRWEVQHIPNLHPSR